MQERQFPPFDVEKLTFAEQGALLSVRARRARWLVASVGASVLALFAIGCPEPGDLQNPGDYPAPAPAGGSATTAGSGTGGSAPTSCETTCMTTIIAAQCKVCHGSATASTLGGSLDLETAGYTARLKDKPSLHKDAGSMCPTGDLLIDSAKPADSWLLKKVLGQQGMCGAAMPLGAPALPAGDQPCFQTYVTCVATGGAVPSGGGTGGT